MDYNRMHTILSPPGESLQLIVVFPCSGIVGNHTIMQNQLVYISLRKFKENVTHFQPTCSPQHYTQGSVTYFLSRVGALTQVHTMFLLLCLQTLRLWPYSPKPTFYRISDNSHFKHKTSSKLNDQNIVNISHMELSKKIVHIFCQLLSKPIERTMCIHSVQRCQSISGKTQI